MGNPLTSLSLPRLGFAAITYLKYEITQLQYVISMLSTELYSVVLPNQAVIAYYLWTGKLSFNSV